MRWIKDRNGGDYLYPENDLELKFLTEFRSRIVQLMNLSLGNKAVVLEQVKKWYSDWCYSHSVRDPGVNPLSRENL